MRRIAASFLTVASAWGAVPSLTFTKSFPGSVPAYVYVGLDQIGGLQYKESPADEKPVVAKLKAADTALLFSMAEKLAYFSTSLESGLKVANTGKKTFRYVDGGGKSREVSFNYSLDVTAQQLLDRFEQIAASERSYLDLDRAVRFDKLGVNDALAAVESLWLRGQLAAPEQFIPLLTRISTHESFMHLVRDRAARLKDAFEAGVAVMPAAAADHKTK